MWVVSCPAKDGRLSSSGVAVLLVGSGVGSFMSCPGLSAELCWYYKFPLRALVGTVPRRAQDGKKRSVGIVVFPMGSVVDSFMSCPGRHFYPAQWQWVLFHL